MSYSRRDEIIMRRIVDYLRQQSIMVWVDNEKLIPGTPIWEDEIEKAIIGAGAIVVLLSPDSKNSPWVRREIGYAEDNEKRIFPILVAGNEKSAIPIRLTSHQRIDIRQNEKIGLDALTTELSRSLRESEDGDQRAREDGEQQARQEAERATREKAAREAAEKTTLEQTESEARLRTLLDEIDRKAAERSAHETADREAANIRGAHETTEREVAEKTRRKPNERMARAEGAKKGSLLFSWWGRMLFCGIAGLLIGWFGFPDFALVCMITGSLTGLLLAPHIYSVYIMLVCTVVFWPILYWVGNWPSISIEGYSTAAVTSVVYVILSPMFAFGIRVWWNGQRKN